MQSTNKLHLNVNMLQNLNKAFIDIRPPRYRNASPYGPLWPNMTSW